MMFSEITKKAEYLKKRLEYFDMDYQNVPLQEASDVLDFIKNLNDDDFVQAFNKLSGAIHQNAVDKGFWEVQSPEEWLDANIGRFTSLDEDSLLKAYEAGQQNPEPNKAEKIALMQSELSEMLEGVRKPGPDTHCPEFTNEEIELADDFIRGMDYAKKFKLRLPEAILAKMSFNAGRPYKHGKNF